MTTTRTSRTATTVLALLATGGLLVGCGGSDDAAPAAPATNDAEPAETAATADEPTEPNESTLDEPADQTDSTEPTPTEPTPSEPAAVEDADATLTLANGESYQFSVLCSLEPQMAAGSEILFTATSYDTPSLDITQFGDEGTITGIASISVYDDSYETLWEANTIYDMGGDASVELRLEGNTISGSGRFYPGGDIAATPVDGEVVANC